MKHKLRDFIILVISLSGLSYLYRLWLRKQGPLVRVLCFHDVADVNWFESVVKMISENYHLITPEEFKTKQFSTTKINILLTFDDGYQSWIDNCLPVLSKYNAKGIFFINSGLLDIAEDREQVSEYMKDRLLISPKQPLTWNGARKLVEAGQTIGGHTVTHPNLASLSMVEAQKEIFNDKSNIEAKLGLTLLDFAYPFGTKKHFSKVLINYVESLYHNQYTSLTSFVVNSKAVLINRTLIEKQQPITQISSWIEGDYDILSKVKNLCVR